jgi:hypothetical protein
VAQNNQVKQKLAPSQLLLMLYQLATTEVIKLAFKPSIKREVILVKG